MALIKCDECGGDVSSKAISCPKCGNPIQAGQLQAKQVVSTSISTQPIKSKKRLFAVPLILGGIIFVALIYVWVTHKDSSVSPVAETNIQQEFEAARISRFLACQKAPSNIRASAIFLQANAETELIVSQNGPYLNHWAGKIQSTVQSDSEAGMVITSSNGVSYVMERPSNILPNSSTYKRLSNFKAGDAVSFSGELIPSSDNDKWMYSYTNRDSRELPVFVVRFDSIESSSNVAALEPTMSKYSASNQTLSVSK